jgi:hypothetical protein
MQTLSERTFFLYVAQVYTLPDYGNTAGLWCSGFESALRGCDHAGSDYHEGLALHGVLPSGESDPAWQVWFVLTWMRLYRKPLLDRTICPGWHWLLSCAMMA